MSEPRLTINELIAALQTKADISDEKAKDFINRYFSLIADELKNNDTSSIYKFGTFKKSLRKSRMARNPRTGESVEVPARYQINFTAAKPIAEKINKPYAKLKPVVIKEAALEKKVKAVPTEDSTAEEVDTSPDTEISMQELALLTGNISPEEKAEPLDLDDVFAMQVEAEIKEMEALEAESLSQDSDDDEINETAPLEIPSQPQEDFSMQEDFQIIHETEKLNVPEKLDVAEHQVAQQNIVQEIVTQQKQEDSSQVVRVIVSAEQSPAQTSSTVTTIHQPGVREQVIERQVIKEQIIEQRVTRQFDAEEQNRMSNKNINIDDYKEDVSAIARCWFVAGIAVVCTIIIVVLLISVAIGAHRTKVAERNAAITRLEIQLAEVAEMRSLKPNTYAEYAASEYGEIKLWPYIYGANRLRYSDPDYEIKIRETMMPPRPDRTLDRTSIEQSAIDAYRMYINEYSDRPNSARGKEKRLRAVRVLADTEALLPGFISRYELSFSLEDIQLARRYLGN